VDANHVQASGLRLPEADGGLVSRETGRVHTRSMIGTAQARARPANVTGAVGAENLVQVMRPGGIR
jgi:hypothetical protein